MNTFYALWKVRTPQEAAKKLAEQRAEFADIAPKNLAQQACKLVGRNIYEKLIRGYTKKQWGRKVEDLPAFIIKRIPVRLTFDNNYFNDTFQGIPSDGYTALVGRMLERVDVRLNIDFFHERNELESLAKKLYLRVVLTNILTLVMEVWNIVAFALKMSSYPWRTIRESLLSTIQTQKLHIRA